MDTEQAWACGFAYGFELDLRMPFEPDTPEVVCWRQGWIQGAMKKVGLPYYKDQMEQAFNRNAPLSPESEFWARKFEDRYFST